MGNELSAPTSSVSPPEEELPDDGSEIENQLHLLRSGDQADVILICGDMRFPGHTHIIGARSDVFRAMFFDLNKDRTLSVVNISPKTLEIVLHYMYSGEVPGISAETALKVYDAAEMYVMESLKNICTGIIKKKIREANAPYILLFSAEKNDNSLKDIAVTYLAGRKSFLLSETWRRFCDNHPKLANDVFLAFVRKTL